MHDSPGLRLDEFALDTDNNLPATFHQEEDMATKNDPRLDHFLPMLKECEEQHRKESWLAWIKKDKRNLISSVTAAITILAIIGGILRWLVVPQLVTAVDQRVETKLKDHNLDGPVSDVANIKSQVQEMKGQLGEISGYVKLLTESELRKDASLSSTSFKKQMPSLSAALAAATVTRASVPPEVVKGIQSRLSSSDKRDLEFWQVASRFVSYRSGLQSAIQAGTLPNCLSLRDPKMDVDHITVGNQQYYIPGLSSVKLPHWQTHATESNCILDLDDDGSFSKTAVGQYFEEVRRLHPSLDVVSIVLDHAVVRYSGGRMIPVTEIRFTNCLFDFRAPKAVPPIPGRKLTDQLLMADLNSGSAQIAAGS